jgi:hypothetical protein
VRSAIASEYGAPLPDAAAWSIRIGADVGDARVVTGTAAEAAADAIGARAFTIGNRIFFGAGESLASERLVRHELTHVIQQRGATVPDAEQLQVTAPGDDVEREAYAAEIGGAAGVHARGEAVIARDALHTDFYSSSSAHRRDKSGATAHDYVKKHAAGLREHVGKAIAGLQPKITTPHVAWATGPRDFMTDVWAPFAAAGDLWSVLEAAIAPDRLDKAVDTGRDVWPFDRGPDDWRAEVVGEIARRIQKRLVESLARVVPRWAKVKNQIELRRRAGRMKDRDPTVDEVAPSHPIDVHVIEALRGGKLKIAFEAYRDDHVRESYARDVRSGSRKVKLSFQHLQGATNWVRVHEPADATTEEVANALYGTSTKAYLLTCAHPLYGIPDPYVLAEPYRSQWREGFRDRRTPARLKPDPYTGPPRTPEQVIVAGPLADEAFLHQAEGHSGTGASAQAVIERMTVIRDLYDRIAADLQTVEFQKEMARYLVGPRARLVERIARLHKTKDPLEIEKWDAHSAQQLEILRVVSAGVRTGLAQSKAFAGFASVKNVAHGMTHRYIDAAVASDLVRTGRQLLDAAEQESRTFPVIILELMLADMRKRVDGAREDKGGNLDNEKRYGISTFERKDAELRAALVRVRQTLLQNPELAKDELDRLVAKVMDHSTGVTLIANMDAIDAAWKALHGSLSFMGEVRAIWGGGNTKLSAAMSKCNRMHAEWHRIYLDWKYGDAKEKEAARAKLKEKAESEEWQNAFTEIKALIQDQATIDKWMTLAALLGIAIVTAGVGAYVGAAAGAAWGGTIGFVAATAAEAATFTTLSYAMIDKDPSLGGYFKEFGKNVLMFGALRTISKVYRGAIGAEAAATTSGKVGEILVQWAAINGVALWEADRAKRAKTGQGLTEAEIAEISFTNLAFVVALAIGVKLAEPWILQLQLKGAVAGHLHAAGKAQAELKALAKQVEASKGKDHAAAQKLLAKQQELLLAEEKALKGLQEIATNPEAAKAAGITPEQAKTVAARQAEIKSNLSQVQDALVAGQLEPVAPDMYLCSRESFDGIRRHYAEQGLKPTDRPADATTGARSFEVTQPERGTFRIIERVSDRAGVVGSTRPARVSEPIQAVWDGIKADSIPDGWTLRDVVTQEGNVKVISTHVEVNGKRGWIERAYDPTTKTFEMRNAFLEDVPTWIKDGAPMVENKGTPTVTWLSLRQMKVLGVDYAAPKTVKMSTIQNIKAIIQLAVLRARGVDVNQAVLKTHSVQYAETTIIQSGMRVKEAKVKGDIWDQPIDSLMKHFENNSPDPAATRAKHDKLLADFGEGVVDRNTKVWMNYDIELTVEPFHGGGN